MYSYIHTFTKYNSRKILYVFIRSSLNFRYFNICHIKKENMSHLNTFSKIRPNKNTVEIFLKLQTKKNAILNIKIVMLL